MQYLRILPVSIILSCLFSSGSRAGLDAFEVFVESCRNSGENLNLIWSGYAEFEYSRESITRSDHEMKLFESMQSKIRGEMEEQLRRNNPNMPPEVLGRNIERIRKEPFFSQDRVTFRLPKTVLT